MTSKEVMPFEFKGNQVRVIKDEQGEPWFVAKDVCDALGHTDPSKAVRSLDDDEKGPRKVRTLGGNQEMVVVNEPGLYKLILRSHMPRAKEFQRWVTHEVLPRIRKTGGYIMGEESLAEDELILKAMQVLQRKVDTLKQQVIEQQPKVEAFDSLMNSEGLYSFRNTARIWGVHEREFRY